MSRLQLEKDIWRACDIMRRDNNCGGVMEYVEHLSWVLFLKFLDGQDQLFAQEAEYAGHAYSPVVTGKYRWADWVARALGQKIGTTLLNGAAPATARRTPPEWDGDQLMQFVRGELIPYLANLHGSPEREVIAGVFGDRNVIVCASPYNLKDVLAIVDQIDFTNQDDVHTVSHAYESLLRKLGHENKVAGEFYTPRSVIRFMVKVLNPRIGETVYDPACGSAGFLVEAYEYMRANQQNATRDYEFLQRHTFFGNEKKSVSALLGAINMVLHGVLSPSIYRRNTLEENIRNVSERYDVVLSNPPFGGTENEQIQENFPVKANATELLFMEHILKKLKPGDGSRCALVVPEGTLFRGGAFATVKKDLLQDFNLFMVVSLPPGTFAPYSDVKTALLFFQRPGPTTEVLYHDLALPGDLKKFSKSKPIADAHFDQAFALWSAWQACLRQPPAERVRPLLPRNAWLETRQSLAERGYDLSARNPNPADLTATPSLDELLTSLTANSHNLTARLESLQARLKSGKEIFQ